MATSRKRNVEIDVVVDDKQARAGLQSIGGEAEKTGKRFSDAAKVIGAAIAFKAVGAVSDFVGSSIDAFSDLNESMNAVEVTFGAASDEVKKLGEESAQSVGLSNAEFNSLAVQMSAFAQTIAGDSGDVAGTIDTLTTRISDFASVMNLDVAEAATLFQSGLAGETEPLRKYGIDLSAARVNAEGLAMGLGDSSGQLSEQEKILVRYETLMDQTDKTAGDFVATSDELANKQRIVNAEMENAKAQIGEGFAPVLEAAIPIMGAAATSGGILATQFMESTGQISEAESHIRQFEAATGATADSAPALLTILKEFGGDMEDLVDAVPLATDEIQKLRDADDDFLISLGFTQDEIEELNRLLEDKLVAATQSARDRGMHPLREATEDVKEETEQATSALQNFEDEVMSQVDPLYGLVKAQDDLAAATQAVKDAAEKHTEDSPEYVAALIEQAQKFEALRVAQLNVADQSGFTRGQFEEHLVNMGIMSREQVDIILAEFDRVNVFEFTGKTITINGKQVGFGLPRAHSGGVVPGSPGQEVPIIAQAGETIIPAGGGTGGGGTEIIQVVLDGKVIAEAVRSRFVRDNRSGRGWS